MQIQKFVVRLTDDYYLMLSVTEDNGNGIYLLFHPDCPLKGIDLLVSMAEFTLLNTSKTRNAKWV